MSLQFHHFYVFTTPGAPAVDKLVSASLVEGAPNIHPGQGTSNRRIFFANGMVEFIWVHNPSEVRGEATRRTHLFERSESLSSGFSPFGICVTADDSTKAENQFSGWSYRPGYLPPGFEIWMADNESYRREPAIFLLNIPKDVQSSLQNKSSPIINPALSLKRIKVAIPDWRDSSSSSDAMKKLSQLSIFQFEEGSQFKARIEVEGAANKGLIDLTAWCPLEIVFV